MSREIQLTEFIGNYGIPFDIMLRLLECKLVSYTYISNKKGGGKDPYINMTDRTWATMNAIKRNSKPFMDRLQNCGFITLREATSILGFGYSNKKVIDLLNASILTERKPSFKISPISSQRGSRTTFVVVDSWFMEYARYKKKLSHFDTPESVMEQEFQRTLLKMLITY